SHRHTPGGGRRRVARRWISRCRGLGRDGLGSRCHAGAGLWPRFGGLLYARGRGRAALVRSQSRGCIGNCLVGYRARYTLDAAAREMADQQRGLEGGSDRDRTRGGRLRIRGLELDSTPPQSTTNIFVAKVPWLSSEAHLRAELPVAVPGWVSLVSRAARADRS